MVAESFCTCIILEKGSRSIPFRIDGTGWLFSYGDNQIFVVNKALVKKIGSKQELLILNKQTINEEIVTKATKVDYESFYVDELTNTDAAIAILDDKIEAYLYELKKNYSPPIPYNNSYVTIKSIDNANPRGSFSNFDSTSPNVLKEFQGKISFTNEKISIPGIGDTNKQQIVYLEPESVDFQRQISQGGIVYISINDKKFPIGLTSALIKGSLRTFNEKSEGYYWSFTHLKDILKLLNRHPMITYSSSYNHLVEYFIDNVSSLRDKVEYFADELITKKLSRLDVNSSVDKFISEQMIQLRGELFSFRFNLFMIEQNLIDKSWWDFSHKNKAPEDNTKLFLVEQFQKTILRSFVIGFFSVVEHSLRSTLRGIDPSILNNAKDPFYKIRNHWLNAVSFNDEEEENFRELLILFATIRNTIHNDGYHYPNRKEDYERNITYEGKTYEFKIGEKFEAEYEDYFTLIEDSINFLWIVFNSSYVRKNYKLT